MVLAIENNTEHVNELREYLLDDDYYDDSERALEIAMNESRLEALDYLIKMDFPDMVALYDWAKDNELTEVMRFLEENYSEYIYYK